MVRIKQSGIGRKLDLSDNKQDLLDKIYYRTKNVAIKLGRKAIKNDFFNSRRITRRSIVRDNK
jgi:hypothetical protein